MTSNNSQEPTHYAIRFKNKPDEVYLQRIRPVAAADPPFEDHEIIIVEQYQEIIALKQELETLKSNAETTRKRA